MAETTTFTVGQTVISTFDSHREKIVTVEIIETGKDAATVKYRNGKISTLRYVFMKSLNETGMEYGCELPPAAQADSRNKGSVPMASKQTINEKLEDVFYQVVLAIEGNPHLLNGDGELRTTFIKGKGVTKRFLNTLDARGYIEYYVDSARPSVKLTPAGRQYAIERGWLTANSEPQADITPADYAAVEAMGEVAANVFGEDCDEALKCEHGVNVVHCTDCYVKSERSDDELDELMREYDRKIAREEMQSLYNSDSGVDADDYRAHIDANVLNVPASDEISKQDAQPEGALTELDGDDWNVLKHLGNQPSLSDGYGGMYNNFAAFNSITLEAAIETLKNRGYITVFEVSDKYEVTEAGYQYLVKRGAITDAGRTAIAQTAPVDGGSDSKLLKCEHGIIVPYCAECYDDKGYARTSKAAELKIEHSARQARNRAIDSLTGDQRKEFERQQAEIRALESKLEAAGAALEFYANTDNWHNDEGVLTKIGMYKDSIARQALAKLAAREQSGAGEGK